MLAKSDLVRRSPVPLLRGLEVDADADLPLREDLPEVVPLGAHVGLRSRDLFFSRARGLAYIRREFIGGFITKSDDI